MAYEPVLLKGTEHPDNIDVDAYVKRGGYETARKVLASRTPDECVQLVKDSQLRGRGGAGFMTGMKWGFLPKDSGKPIYLAVNADESEPGTFKDRVLLEKNPHLMLEGILIAAWAIRSHHAYVYLRGEFTLGHRIVQRAIDQAYAKGILGNRALGTDFKLDVTMLRGAGAYICGEETGMLESIEGKRGQPRNKPPFPAVSGLFGCPTIINNVETLCALPPMFERGLDWWKSLGSEKNYGPKLWCVSGHVKRPGVYETAMGIPLQELIDEHCGGIRDGGHRWKAAVPGGSSCGILRADEFHAKLDFDSLRPFGTSLGTGGVMAWDETTCIPAALLNFTEFYAEESCGQCTPCRQGCMWAAKVLHRIVQGHATVADVDEAVRIANGFNGLTICALADAAAIPILSYIQKFPEEFRHHAEHHGACDVQPGRAVAHAGGH